MSNGPSSFGPTEDWDKIVFVDMREYETKHIKIYMFELSNKCNEWSNIKVNQTTTFKTQCRQGRRPRISFDNIRKQIDQKYIITLFDGSIDSL